MTAAQIALWGTVAAYGLLALLLLSLNIFSLWRWWVKAAAMLVTAAVFLGAYVIISGLIGWPSEGQLPPRFALLNTYVEEPDKQRGDPGHIYLWVQEINAEQIPISPPRAYALPYVTETMKGVTESQEMLDRGEAVLGESKTQVTATSDKPAEKEGENANDLTAEQGETNLSSGGNRNAGAGSIFGFPGGQNIEFSAMPAISLPQKAASPNG
jgi:hypothetical protein